MANNHNYNILFTHGEPILFKHVRGYFYKENITVTPARPSLESKIIPHLLRVTPVSAGTYRCLTSDHEEWLVIDLDMF